MRYPPACPSVANGFPIDCPRARWLPATNIAVPTKFVRELSDTRTTASPSSTLQASQTRFSAALSGEEENPDVEGRGYKDIGEQLHDLGPVVDVVWVSGTPPLQITFLLTIALNVATSLQSFPFTPRPTFPFLRKLDLAFSSLLKGVSVETGQPLPGFDGGKGRLSTTEKVRMRGIVERTRVVIVEVAGKEGSLADVRTISRPETETEDDLDMTADDDDVENLEDESSHRRWEMDIAKVYEKTIVELGMALDTSPTGNDG
ncbi:MAG: hypothetical protein Q9184_002137 [Pyrenodesmia sp. 2 TL-2023]